MQINVEKPSVTKWLVVTGNAHYDSTNGYYGLFPALGSDAPGGVYWHEVTVTVPAPFSGGTCCFTQLVAPDHEYNGAPDAQNNGVNGLDTSFEYNGYTWSLPSLGAEEDSPGIVEPTGVAYGDKITVNDTLQDWVMYKPSGGVWVPLQTYSYAWGTTLTWTSPGTWFASNPYPPPPNPGGTYVPTDTDDPPTWTVIQQGKP